MKKIVSIILVLVLCAGFCSCGSKDDGKVVIGVCQLVQHPALDKATQGFVDTVIAKLGEENVEVLEEVASGDISSCTTIVNGFLAKDVDLMMANATAALQAAAAATDTIPVLGTSITSYTAALDLPLEGWDNVVGGNVSGTSDLADLVAQAKMVKEWFPDAKKVGIVFCSGEPNSVFQAAEVEKTFAELGLESKRFTFTDSNDVAGVVQSACEWADALYIPTDNTAANNAEAIANIVIERKVPVISGEKEACKSFGIAALSIDYYDLGVTTGEMAVELLKNGADISTMKIGYAPYTSYYNKEMCDIFGIVPLDGYIAIE